MAHGIIKAWTILLINTSPAKLVAVVNRLLSHDSMKAIQMMTSACVKNTTRLRCKPPILVKDSYSTNGILQLEL